MADDLLAERLPPDWSYGVTSDGRVFFISERNRKTTWLHPVTGRPIQTGHKAAPGLSKGWELDYTPEGATYFIDHKNQQTTFGHPVTGRPVSEEDPPPPPSSPPLSPSDKTHLKTGNVKQRSLRAPSAKRNPNSQVMKRGFLYRLESGGISKTWKKRYCVLADFALFVYKSDDEKHTLGSVLLPGYRINPCTTNDPVQKKFAFKVEHENTKTVYFYTDTQTDLNDWVSSLQQAAIMRGSSGFLRETNNNIRVNPSRSGEKSPPYSMSPDGVGNRHPNHDYHFDPQWRSLNQDQHPYSGKGPPHHHDSGLAGQQPWRSVPDLGRENADLRPGLQEGNYDPHASLQSLPQIHSNNRLDFHSGVNRNSQEYTSTKQIHDPQRDSLIRNTAAHASLRSLPNGDREFSSATGFQPYQRPTDPQQRSSLVSDPGVRRSYSGQHHSPRDDILGEHNQNMLRGNPQDARSSHSRETSRDGSLRDGDRTGWRGSNAGASGYAPQSYEDERQNISANFRHPNQVVHSRENSSESVDKHRRDRSLPESNHNLSSQDPRASYASSGRHSIASQSRVVESEVRGSRHSLPRSFDQQEYGSRNNLSRNPGSPPHLQQQAFQNMGHTYENLPERRVDGLQQQSLKLSTLPPPQRPPYPVAVRDLIVQELADSRSPSTGQLYLIANQLNKERMQQSSYFQYPTLPREQHLSKQDEGYNQQNSDSLRQQFNSGEISSIPSRDPKRMSETHLNDHGEVGDQGSRSQGEAGDRGSRSLGEAGNRGSRSQGEAGDRRSRSQGEAGDRRSRSQGEAGDRGSRSQGETGDRGSRSQGFPGDWDPKLVSAAHLSDQGERGDRGSRSQQGSSGDEADLIRRQDSGSGQFSDSFKFHSHDELQRRNAVREPHHKTWLLTGAGLSEEPSRERFDGDPEAKTLRQAYKKVQSFRQSNEQESSQLEADGDLASYPFEMINKMGYLHFGQSPGELDSSYHILSKCRTGAESKPVKETLQSNSFNISTASANLNSCADLFNQQDLQHGFSSVSSCDDSCFLPDPDNFHELRHAVSLGSNYFSPMRLAHAQNSKQDSRITAFIESEGFQPRLPTGSRWMESDSEMNWKISIEAQDLRQQSMVQPKSVSPPHVSREVMDYQPARQQDDIYRATYYPAVFSDGFEESFQLTTPILLSKSKDQQELFKSTEGPCNEMARERNKHIPSTVLFGQETAVYEPSDQLFLSTSLSSPFSYPGHHLTSTPASAEHQHTGWRDFQFPPRRAERDTGMIFRQKAEDARPVVNKLPIQTVREEPDMPDDEVLETKLRKNKLNGVRLRMSISAGDLIGKTHDELVLLLIQLRRNQAALEKARDFYREMLTKQRPAEREYRRQRNDSVGRLDRSVEEGHQSFVDIRSQMEEVEKKLEVYRPLINLVDNMVTMGSLYGGDNLMLATQYRKHLLRPDQYQAPRKMLEFSRQHQEERIVASVEEDIRQLTTAEVDLEEKMERLNELDHLLQEQSFKVSSFREDKELLEKALAGIQRQLKECQDSRHEWRRLNQQQLSVEKELSRVTQDLAEASKSLEQITAENNRIEHEIALLKTKVHGELKRSKSAPSLTTENANTKVKMERELARVQNMLQGLSQQGEKLSQAMSTLRRSSSGPQLAEKGEEKNRKMGTYLQTDIDTGEQIDLAQQIPIQLPTSPDSIVSSPVSPSLTSKPLISHQRQDNTLGLNSSTSDADLSRVDWDISDADDNTKRFYGLLPREKPRGLTVRDVKRQSEQRKMKRDPDGEVEKDIQEVALKVSSTDSETSTIIHKRYPSYTSSQSSNLDLSSLDLRGSSAPLYENLPRSGSMPALNQTNSSDSRRSSINLLCPKPFIPYEDRTIKPFKSEQALNAVEAPAVPGRGLSLGGHGGSAFSAAKPHASEMTLSASGDNSSYSGVVNAHPVQVGYPSESLVPQPAYVKSSILPTYLRSAQPFRPDSAVPSVQNDSANVALSSSKNSTLANSSGQKNHRETSPIPKRWERGTVRARIVMLNANKPQNDQSVMPSSQPKWIEPKIFMSPTIHSSAGDLITNARVDNIPDIVKSSQTQMDKIDLMDHNNFEREILSLPEKVLIPERYDAEADAEELTESERLEREEKAERIKRLLTQQSILSMSQPDLNTIQPMQVHSQVVREKQERAQLLTLNQELARQVTQQSRKAAAERRKTWSGGQFADIKKQYEAEMSNRPDRFDVSVQKNRQANVVL